MYKICKGCSKIKLLEDFYFHPKTLDKHLNKCKECVKFENRPCNGKYQKICIICKIQFNTTLNEIKRGGAKVCSRKCWYILQRKIIKRDEKSPNWKGENVGLEALHNWVQRHRGKPSKCEFCNSEEDKFYDWANKSGEYKRELTDWIRLCRKCHKQYDKK